ncbi:hypothetical protein G6F42_015684 [Rhizopus arrhizus]|nr:hypothetical protein G6F42_015684 [Rhizopus arrhizus]
MEKERDEFIVATARYLRTLNADFIVNGKTYKDFRKVDAQFLNQISVGLSMEAVRMKMINGALVDKALRVARDLRKKNSTLGYLWNVYNPYTPDMKDALFTKAVTPYETFWYRHYKYEDEENQNA